MARTHDPDISQGVPLSQLPAAALRAVLKEGYSLELFKKDAMAGFVVGVVSFGAPNCTRTGWDGRVDVFAPFIDKYL